MRSRDFQPIAFGQDLKNRLFDKPEIKHLKKANESLKQFKKFFVLKKWKDCAREAIDAFHQLEKADIWILDGISGFEESDLINFLDDLIDQVLKVSLANDPEITLVETINTALEQTGFVKPGRKLLRLNTPDMNKEEDNDVIEKKNEMIE